jgi:hypothetical protein
MCHIIGRNTHIHTVCVCARARMYMCACMHECVTGIFWQRALYWQMLVMIYYHLLSTVRVKEEQKLSKNWMIRQLVSAGSRGVGAGNKGREQGARGGSREHGGGSRENGPPCHPPHTCTTDHHKLHMLLVCVWTHVLTSHASIPSRIVHRWSPNVTKARRARTSYNHISISYLAVWLSNSPLTS